MYHHVRIVDVPLGLRRELDWLEKVPEQRLAEVVAHRCGAPHLDTGDELVADLLCRMATPVADARDTTLPEPDAVRSAAGDMVADWTLDELLAVLRPLGLQRKQISCEAGRVEAAVRDVVVVEVDRLLWRAAKNPPKRGRRRRDAA